MSLFLTASNCVGSSGLGWEPDVGAEEGAYRWMEAQWTSNFRESYIRFYFESEFHKKVKEIWTFFKELVFLESLTEWKMKSFLTYVYLFFLIHIIF